MLSTGVNHSGPIFGRFSTNNIVSDSPRPQNQQPPMAGLDALATGSQYAMQQMQEESKHGLKRPHSQYCETMDSLRTRSGMALSVGDP